MHQIRLFTLLIAIPAALLIGQTDPPGRVGRLSYANGPVSLQPAGMTDWVDADINRPLTTGDQVWVGGGGRAEIHVGSTALRLDENTAFEFLNLDDQTVQIQLSQGTLTVRVRNLAQYQNVELDTPSMAFTVLRPGEYRLGADPDSETTIVTVRGGAGEVTGGGQTFPVLAGQRAIVMGYDQITYRLASAPRPDGWDQWNSSRDLREEQSISARYVSREMVGYQDLDQYGFWSNQPGYGQVWMPRSVSAGWAPYHDGYWAWISPWGWTWVDDAPWGFAPYHYGRWCSFGGRWGWIPGPYGVTPMYAPALVGWIGGGRGGSGFSFSLSFSFGSAAAIGWFPLGPREPYFPSYSVSSGYFSRVNTTNTVINTTTINNYYSESRNPNNVAIGGIRYANQSVPNAVLAVPQDRFSSGRRVAEISRAVPAEQLGSARIAVAPEIAPQRVSVLGPRAAEAPRAPRPAATVLSRPVVARTAPPPAAVPFDRQQAVLNQNPGRPLPAEKVQQLRQNAPARTAPVRVVDMGKVQRVQPVVGAETQGGQQPNVPQPAAAGRNVPPGQQRQQQQQDVQRQQQQQQLDTQRQQQLKQQQEAQQQQQQRQQLDTQRQQQLKQQQEAQQQQQQRQQLDTQRQQQLKQQQDAQEQQQQRQQLETQRQQQLKQQQEAQQQQQQRQQLDAQRQQQLKQQQDAQQQQQQRQQQDSRRQQNAPPADVVQQPSTPPPAERNQSNAPAANVNRRQQAPPADQAAVPERARPNRPEAQAPQAGPPQAANQAQAPAAKQQPAAKGKAARDKAAQDKAAKDAEKEK